MIISHKHKFIFLKPTKCASTSVEISLAKTTGGEDIVTKVSTYDSTQDDSEYEDLSKNDEGFYNHMKPEEIKKKIPEEIWRTYKKITIVRNPWDLVVSRYFWEKNKSLKYKLRLKAILKNIFSIKAYLNFFKFYRAQKANDEGNFTQFAENIIPQWKNTDYYFDKKGELIPDIILRFESLNEDYKQTCK